MTKLDHVESNRTAVAVVVFVVLLLLSACVSEPGDGAAADTEPAAEADDAADAAGGEGAEATEMSFSPEANGLICDGTRQVVGVLSGANPYEPIDFDAPGSPMVLVGEAKADGTLAIYWTCPPSQGNRQWPVTARGMDSQRSVAFTVDGRLPPPPNEGGIAVEVVENPFSCDGEERVLVELTNLTPNVEVNFEITPESEPFVGSQADADGNLTLYWRCGDEQVRTAWQVEVVESTPEPRRATFLFAGTDKPYQPPADIEMVENPFSCDSTAHELAVLSGFVPNEFVRFTSPQSENIRGGQADENGVLPIRWYCEADDVGKRWQVTATGQTSLATVRFTIIGAEPGG